VHRSVPTSVSRRAPDAVDLSLSLGLVAALALGVRLLGIGAHSVWFDEALEFARAARGIPDLVMARAIEQDPPLLALFMHFWIRLGRSEAWLRLPSALVGTAAVVVLAGWTWRRLGRRTGRLVGLLAAIAPVMVHYGQELNQYAWILFLAPVALAAAERVLARDRPVDWVLYGVLSLVALGTHYGMVFPLAALGVVVVHSVRRRGTKGARRALTAYAAAVVAWVAFLWRVGLSAGIGVPHLQARFGGTHLAKELSYIGDVGWREVLVFFLLPFAGGPAVCIVAVVSVLALLGAVVLLRAGPPGRRVVGAMFFGSLALTYLTSLMGWYPLGYRYGLFAAPFLLVAVAAGLDLALARSRPLGVVLGTGVVIAMILFNPHTDPVNPFLAVPREELRPVLARTDARREPGDRTYVGAAALPTYRYYRPGDLDVVAGRAFAAATAGLEAERIGGLVGRSPRLWVVLTRVTASEREALLRALVGDGAGGRWTVAEEVAEENAVAFLMVR
jgi:hypothetical protein